MLRETGLLVALGLAAAAEEGRSNGLRPDGLWASSERAEKMLSHSSSKAADACAAYSVDAVGRGERELVALVEGAWRWPKTVSGDAFGCGRNSMRYEPADHAWTPA